MLASTTSSTRHHPSIGSRDQVTNRAAHKGNTGQPTKGIQGPNRAPDRALIGTLKNVIFFHDFYNSVIKTGREYFHWVDLRLIKPMEEG